ncbi:MAG TPA: hypothetical protein DCS87_04525 [Rheinheimera sp.]|nr:hypothetical protein [Rheinheimera sp.]
MAASSISRPIGGLFVKFLLAFWSALLLAYALISAANQLQSKHQERVLHSPQLRLVSQTARVLASRGDTEVLKEVLQTWEDDRFSRERLLVLDEQGQDILQRPVPADWPAKLAAIAERYEISVRDPQGHLWQFLPLEREMQGAMATPTLKGWSGSPPPRDLHGAMPDEMSGGMPKPPVGAKDAGPKPPFWFQPWFLLAVVLFTSTVASLGLAWYFAAPVRKLKQALEQLAEQQWRTQLGSEVTSRHDEFGALGRSFNQMAQNVYLAMLSQRRLLHDVSHELRSPLARLQIVIGLARQDPAELANTLDRVEAETQRLDRLVGEILTFSRLESGELQGKQQLVYVHELLESICDDAQLEADAAHKSLMLQPLPVCAVLADAELLFRAFENVVRNALKYTPEGASVWVRAQVQAQWLTIDVDDDGQGVPDEMLQRLFQPFFRGQSSHDGVGLGLSIAQRAVAAAGGSIEAQNRYDDLGAHVGFRIRIKLPLHGGQ